MGGHKPTLTPTSAAPQPQLKRVRLAGRHGHGLRAPHRWFFCHRRSQAQLPCTGSQPARQSARPPRAAPPARQPGQKSWAAGRPAGSAAGLWQEGGGGGTASAADVITNRGAASAGPWLLAKGSVEKQTLMTRPKYPPSPTHPLGRPAQNPILNPVDRTTCHGEASATKAQEGHERDARHGGLLRSLLAQRPAAGAAGRPAVAVLGDSNWGCPNRFIASRYSLPEEVDPLSVRRQATRSLCAVWVRFGPIWLRLQRTTKT